MQIIIDIIFIRQNKLKNFHMHIKKFRAKNNLMHPLMLLIILRQLYEQILNQALQLINLKPNQLLRPNRKIQSLLFKLLKILTLIPVNIHLNSGKILYALHKLIQNILTKTHHILHRLRTSEHQIPIQLIKHRRHPYTLHIPYVQTPLLVLALKRPNSHHHQHR